MHHLTVNEHVYLSNDTPVTNANITGSTLLYSMSEGVFYVRKHKNIADCGLFLWRMARMKKKIIG